MCLPSPLYATARPGRPQPRPSEQPPHPSLCVPPLFVSSCAHTPISSSSFLALTPSLLHSGHSLCKSQHCSLPLSLRPPRLLSTPIPVRPLRPSPFLPTPPQSPHTGWPVRPPLVALLGRRRPGCLGRCKPHLGPTPFRPRRPSVRRPFITEQRARSAFNNQHLTTKEQHKSSDVGTLPGARLPPRYDTPVDASTLPVRAFISAPRAGFV